MTTSLLSRCLTLLVALGFLISQAHGSETLAAVPDTAQALGTVGGRIANLRDASTVRVSPSNILYADSPEVLVNASVWNGGVKFHSSFGVNLETQDPWKYLGSVYAIFPVEPGRVAFGLGISTPYGLDSSYPRNSALRYLVPFDTQLLTLDITPAVAFKVTDTVSFGIGMDIMYSKLKLKQVYPWSIAAGGLPYPDGEIAFDGDGWGVGAYAGLTWEITKAQRISIVGRLPVTVDYSGSFQSKGQPAALGALGFQKRSTFNSDITFPGSVSAGYGIDLTDKFTMGFDFMWSNNTAHDDVPLKIGANQALLASSAVPLGWHDSIDLGLGLSYKLDEHWTLRSGYLWSQNSQGEKNYTPAVPANDRHAISAGFGWSNKHDSVDLAYAFVLFPDRHITGASQPAFNGDYENSWHVLTLSYTHRF